MCITTKKMNPRYQRTQKFMNQINTDLFHQVIDIPHFDQEKPEENKNYLSIESGNEVDSQNNEGDISFKDIKLILSEIKFLNLEIIDSLVEGKKVCDELWSSISLNYNFDISWYEKYPDKPWDVPSWCFSHNFDISWCLKHPQLNWSWVDISRHSNLKLEWVKENDKLPWCWSAIVAYQDLDLEWLEILANQKAKTKIWKKLSDHPRLELSWLKKYSYFPWNWKYISENHNLQLEWLQTFPYKPWDWQVISDSPNLEYSWYLAFPDKNWSICDLIINPSFLSSYREYQAIRYMSAYKIQKWWRKILYNPHSKPGSLFVSKLYDENFTNT